MAELTAAELPLDSMERQQWRNDPPYARALGRGGAPHIGSVGDPHTALCGLPLGDPLPENATWNNACQTCRTLHSEQSYQERYTLFWGPK